jgi:uncharacterized protein (DUF433 family)
VSITTDAEVLHGLPRIEGTRISVLHVYDTVVAGDTDPAGAADALGLSLGEVYEALAYYYNNPGEMRTHRATQDEAREELRSRAVTPPVEPDGSR